MSLPKYIIFLLPQCSISHTSLALWHILADKLRKRGKHWQILHLHQLLIKWIQRLKYNDLSPWLRLRLNDLFITCYISLEAVANLRLLPHNSTSHTTFIGVTLWPWTLREKKCHRKEHQLPCLIDVRSSRQEGQVATRIFWCPTPAMFKQSVLILMYDVRRCAKFPAKIRWPFAIFGFEFSEKQFLMEIVIVLL